MAKTRDYMDYLDNEIGIAPANSQEEFQAAETIVEVMKDHGVEPTIQEFDTHPMGVLMPSILSIVLFVGVLLTGLSAGWLRAIGLVLSLVAAILLGLHHSGKDVLENVGPVQRSQNVIGVHRATGENVVKGSRPIVIVAHYDTPRENFLFGSTFARYQSVLYKNAYICVIVAAVVALSQILTFLPAALRVVLWIVGLLACVPLIIIAVASILERFAGCTAGSNDNKASVAAMLSVLNEVSPAEDRVDAAAEGRPYVRRASEDKKPETIMVPEKPVGVRHGKEVIQSLGMLPPTCEIVYEEPKLVSVPVGEVQSAQPGALQPNDSENIIDSPAEEQSDKTASAEPQGSMQNDNDSTVGVDSVEAKDEESTSSSDEQDAAVNAQYDDEYYIDNTEVSDPQNVEYNGISNDEANKNIDLKKESSATKRGSSTKKKNKKKVSDQSAGSGLKGWFNRVKSRFAHDDEPVQIARGKNKDQTSSDYSEYETTYSGDDELDQWSTGETEQLRPLRAHEVRGGRVEQRIDTEYDNHNHEQSLGDIYGQFDDEYSGEEESVEATEDQELPSTSSGRTEDTDAIVTDDIDEPEIITSDHEASQSDENVPVESVKDDNAEAVRNTPQVVSDEDQDDESWDIEDDSESIPQVESVEDSDIPEPISIDTGAGKKRHSNASPKSQESSADEDNAKADSNDAEVEEVQATVLPDEGNDEGNEESLAWDKPSVEDEEYYEEYPQDGNEDAGNEEAADDEYYEDDPDDFDYAQYVAEVPEAWHEDEPNVYEEAEESRGGFHKFATRVKNFFRGGSSKAETESAEEFPLDNADSYDEGYGAAETSDEVDLPNGDASQQDAAEELQFEEVKSEEYLPSDRDALNEDVADDYDFDAPESEDRISETTEAQTPKSGKVKLDVDSDDRSDILPKDTSGLDALLDDDYADSADTPRNSPEPIDDPTWGKSTYEPPVSRASIARRAALLDLPNPSIAPVDPLADEEEDASDEPDKIDAKKGSLKHGAGLDDTAAQANTDQNRKRHWKGGAAVRSDLRQDDDSDVADGQLPLDEPAEISTEKVTQDESSLTDETHVPDEGEVQDAILDLGSDLLLTHDVWFVAVGASSVGHAGIKSFLANFRKDIRGAFLINLDSIGAGVPVVLTREGLDNGKRADRRSLRLFEDTAKDLHFDVQSIDYGWRDTDATPAMRSRVRSITVMGMDENGLPALSHTLNDVPMNVDPKQVSSIVRVVCEFIRRS